MLKYSQPPGIFKLEGNRLGRPYHRLPTLFTGNFDAIESHLGNYFLKKHRTNISLSKIHCEMDVINKSAELMISQIGHLAFDIDRALLLMLLSHFYGLEATLADHNPHDDFPTKTESRLKSRLAMDIGGLIFNKNTSGIPLTLKPDSSTIQTRWAYQLSFILDGDKDYRFRILLDDAHTDYILNLIRRHDHSLEKHQTDKSASETERKTLLNEIIHTLPLTMNVKIAELALNVADLTIIKPGDILPVSLPEHFPVYIGRSQLFNALIVEDKDKLFLSALTNKTETSYE